MRISLYRSADEEKPLTGRVSVSGLQKQTNCAGTLDVNIFDPIVVAALRRNQGFKIDAIDFAVGQNHYVGALWYQVGCGLNECQKEFPGCCTFTDGGVAVNCGFVGIDQNIQVG